MFYFVALPADPIPIMPRSAVVSEATGVFSPTPPPSVVVVPTSPPVPVHRTLLEVAIASIGKPRMEEGWSEFWCAEFVEWALQEAGFSYDTALDSPAQLQSLMPAVTLPLPGDLVFVSFQPEYRQTHHVGVVTSVNEDGSVNTIEGNGPDPERVAVSKRSPVEITGYGRA